MTSIPAHVFRGYDLRGLVGPELNEQTVELLAKGYATWLLTRQVYDCVLGFDCKNANACKAGLPAKLETFLKDFREANVAAKFALEYLFLLHKRPLC